MGGKKSREVNSEVKILLLWSNCSAFGTGFFSLIYSLLDICLLVYLKLARHDPYILCWPILSFLVVRDNLEVFGLALVNERLNLLTVHLDWKFVFPPLLVLSLHVEMFFNLHSLALLPLYCPLAVWATIY